MEQTITVTEIRKTNSGNGWWVNKFTCFEQSIIDQLKIGNSYNVEIEENSKGYKQIKEILGEGSPQEEKLEINPSKKPLTTSSKATIHSVADKDKSIIAQCLTKCVTEVWCAKVRADKEITTEPIDAVFNAYQEFLKKLG